MTDFFDGFYKKTPTPVKFALRSFLRFTIEPMTADRELQELVREFEQGGLPNLFSHPPTPTPCEETPPAPRQPMQTGSTRKKFKPEVHSKWNEDRHKQSGKTLEDPEMNPSGSTEIPPEGFEDFSKAENLASHRPRYLLPVRPGVQLP